MFARKTIATAVVMRRRIPVHSGFVAAIAFFLMWSKKESLLFSRQ
jgi:hypothetical protein